VADAVADPGELDWLCAVPAVVAGISLPPHVAIADRRGWPVIAAEDRGPGFRAARHRR